MAYRYTNNAATTLSGSVTSGATSISVSSASDFPTQGNFTIIVDSEIMVVTGVSGTTWTVTRGAEDTSAAAHTNNSAVTHILTKASFLNSHWFDVRAFGATGDGTTDDLDALDAAATAAAASGAPATIYFPPGSYYVTDTWVLDMEAVHVECDPNAEVWSDQATTYGGVVAASGYIGTSPATTPQRTWFSWHGGKIRNTDDTDTENGIGIARYKNARVEGVRFSAVGKKAITAQYGVDNVFFEGNVITDAGVNGITVETTCDFVHIVANDIVSAGGNAINVTGSVTDCHIERNYIGSGAIGISIGGSSGRAWIKDNTVVETTGTGTGISVITQTGAVIEGNHVANTNGHGILCMTVSTRLEVIGNYVSAAGAATTDTYDAIRFDSCTVRPIVIGNRVSGSDHKYAINSTTMTNLGPVAVGNVLAAGVTDTFGGETPQISTDAGAISAVSVATSGDIDATGDISGDEITATKLTTSGGIVDTSVGVSLDLSGTGVIQFSERAADAGAPASNKVRIYAKDNGSGKTQLVARFPTGAVQVIATEP